MYYFNGSASSYFIQLVIQMAVLFIGNEIVRRWKYVGLFCFTVLPAILSVLWFTVLKDQTFTDWFHIAKVYSASAGCLGFWCIRYLKGTNRRTGKEWSLSGMKWALIFPPLILAVNIGEACARDFQVGNLFYGIMHMLPDEEIMVLGGPWNYMNGIAGILNIVTITGWLGICVRKKTKNDGSRDMLWPDMLWFWIIAYDLWNFAYTYNCLPGASFYCGIGLLLAPTICAFTVGKGAWLQHRAQTLALYCMAGQTFPLFLSDTSGPPSSYDPFYYNIVSAIALASNIAVFGYMIYKVIKAKKNPYTNDIFTDLKEYKEIKSLAE